MGYLVTTPIPTYPQHTEILFVGQSKWQNFFIAQESNLRLAARQVAAEAQNQWKILASANSAALKKSACFVLGSLYDKARTYFMKHT